VTKILKDSRLRRKALGVDSIPDFNDYSFMDYSMDHDAVTLMIDQWHDSDSDKELHEYLGWSEQEFAHYLESNVLPW
jgi:hypothetical protein